MECCSDGTVEKDTSFRVTIKESRQKEPLKFQLLSAIGLREYLIERFIFSRGQPEYDIIEENGKKVFTCPNGIDYPPEYTAETTMIEDQLHSIPAVMLSLKDRSKYLGTVVYSHGNCSDLRSSLRFIAAFASTLPRFDYLVYDYTGYGRSGKQSTTQLTVIQDLQLVLKSIRVREEEVILWGFSLGAYPSVFVAKGRAFKGVLLQSPLASVYALFAEQLTPYSTFDNDCFSLLQHLPKVNSFLVIVHSRDDETVPFSHAKVLFQRYQMINSNPFCFLLQVEKLKHNEMHALLSSPHKNHLRDSFHNYFKLMAEQGELPMARVFQLQKNKYFDNLGELNEGIIEDTADKATLEDPSSHQLAFTDSLLFTDLKRERGFEIDDISNEEAVDMNYYMEVKAEQHADYFQRSQQAREETEVESIPSEQNLPDIYQ